MAMLLDLLVSFGNAVGPGPHVVLLAWFGTHPGVFVCAGGGEPSISRGKGTASDAHQKGHACC